MGVSGGAPGGIDTVPRGVLEQSGYPGWERGGMERSRDDTPRRNVHPGSVALVRRRSAGARPPGAGIHATARPRPVSVLHLLEAHDPIEGNRPADNG
jgi:hypothetical protein